jgi:glucokinase
MEDNVILAVDLGGTNLRVGKIQKQAIIDRVSRPVPVTDQPEVVLNALTDAIRSLFDQNVAAIGIGVPSVVDVDRGIVYDVTNIPSWKEVHLKDALEKSFNVPAYVNNDANCFALGEFHYGKGRGFRNMVGIILGTGLGSGIIIDRRLYSGTNCGAGEIGTIPHKDQTVEYYASGAFFARECGMSGEVVFEQARAGDPAALRAYDRFGAEVAHAVMIALYAYDPEIVIFGGSVSKAFSLFRNAMMEKLLSTFAYQHALKRLILETSELPDVAMLGAAGLYLDALEKRNA